jgi:ribosomal protein L11 methyltransferase
VTVGRLWVGPPWESPPAGLVPVIIDPGRAFGTGAHPSTRLCLELLLEQPPSSLLDVGCGSGVVAIAAAKLGFGPIVAVDVDEVAVEVTLENARANGVSVATHAADATSEALPEVALAVANISLALVEAAAGRLRSPRVITAGYLASDRPQLAGFRSDSRRELDGWGADVFVRG